jgi:cell division protein FtsW
VLVIFGLMMIYSATFTWPSSGKFLLKQGAFAILGFGALAVLSLLHYGIWQRRAVPIMGLCVLSLIAVLLLGGGPKASSWVQAGSVQPTEFVKLGFVVYMAAWLAPKGGRIRDVTYGLFPFAALLGVVTGLIVLEPDFGAAALIAGTALGMFFVAGADLKQLLVSMLTGASVLWLLVSNWPYALARLRVFTAGPASDPLRTGYHIQTILTALSSGGLFGRGLGNGEFKLMLPLPHTDAIFPVIGEELGLVGCAAVIALYLFIVWRGMSISLHAPNMFSSLLAAGMTLWIALQALVHIAGNTATLPYTGVTLPFISYGGSSLIMTLAAMGVLLGVSRYRVEKPVAVQDTAFAFGRRNRRPRLSRTGRRRRVENRIRN